MKLSQIFEEFIEVVRENNYYVIGFLNNGGTVLYSSQSESIGRKVDLDNPGANDYVYQIEVKDKKYGYLWVFSKDKSVSMVGNVLKESLKTRITYELSEDITRSNRTKDDELIRHLIEDETFDLDSVLELVNELNMDKSQTRVAIFIVSDQGFNTEDVFNLKYKTSMTGTIYSLISEEHLLLYKDVPDDLSNKKVKEHLKRFIDELIEWGINDSYYAVGSLQDKLPLYSVSYKNCLWMKQNIRLSKNTPVFFEDYVFNYFVSSIHLSDISHTFDHYIMNSSNINVDELIEIAQELFIQDFNITQAAESLFLHKNTLIYKLKRYEKVFNLDIRGSFQGKIIFYLLANYFKEEKRHRQVGADI